MNSSTPTMILVSGYADAAAPGIWIFALDEARGALRQCGSYAGMRNPSFVLAHPNGRWLYAVSETSAGEDGPGAVWALHLQRDPPALEPLNQQPSGGDAPCHLQLDSSGRWLLVSNYGSGSVGVLPVREDGSLGELADLVRHHGRGTHPERQAGPHAHSATWTPDDRLAIVADLGIDQLMVYAFDRASGKLELRKEVAARPGAGPRHGVFGRDGRQLYVSNELDNTVSVFTYDAATGALHEQQTLATLPADAPPSTAAHIALAPDGRRVYVSNRGHNSIAVFDVAADGRLSPVATPASGGDGPRHFGLVPGGRWLLAANQGSGEVAVLPVLDDAAALGAPVASVAMEQASCVQCVPALG